jgi:hypothetical protein
VGGRIARRNWNAIVGELAQREKLLKLRIERYDWRLEEQRERMQAAIDRRDAIIDAQRLVIENLLSRKQKSNS